MKSFIKNITKTRKGLFYLIIISSTFILTFSYGIFSYLVNDIKLSNMLIGNLMYGINITDEEGMRVNFATVDAGETKDYYVTIYSINSVASKYILAFSPKVEGTVSPEGITVTSINRNGWSASGSINEFENYAYKRTIKVRIENTSNITKDIYFKAFGGLKYNSVANIGLGDGYYIVINVNENDYENYNENDSFISYTYKNDKVDIDYSTFVNGLGTKYTATFDCLNGTKAEIKENGTIEYESLVLPDSCKINFDDKSYNITANVNNTNFGTVNSVPVVYGKTATLTVSPTASWYYLNSVSCTNGYTIENVETGKTATFEQNIIVANNSNTSDSVCTFEFKEKECWLRGGRISAKYSCNGENCTMSQCRVSGYVCKNLTFCRYNSSYNQSYQCNSSLDSVSIYGVSYPNTINRSQCVD